MKINEGNQGPAGQWPATSPSTPRTCPPPPRRTSWGCPPSGPSGGGRCRGPGHRLPPGPGQGLHRRAGRTPRGSQSRLSTAKRRSSPLCPVPEFLFFHPTVSERRFCFFSRTFLACGKKISDMDNSQNVSDFLLSFAVPTSYNHINWQPPLGGEVVTDWFFQSNWRALAHTLPSPWGGGSAIIKVAPQI